MARTSKAAEVSDSLASITNILAVCSRIGACEATQFVDVRTLVSPSPEAGVAARGGVLLVDSCRVHILA